MNPIPHDPIAELDCPACSPTRCDRLAALLIELHGDAAQCGRAALLRGLIHNRELLGPELDGLARVVATQGRRGIRADIRRRLAVLLAAGLSPWEVLDARQTIEAGERRDSRGGGQ